jgi:NAD(P)-dependent dehydrogenase (short-subunit alcohol dehydrogenase family)
MITMESKNLGKKILVIGGGTGMGKAIALRLSNEGANVLIAGRRKDKLLEVAEDSNQAISIFQADITDRNSITELFAWFDRKVGELDILINAAGINIANRSMMQLSPIEWDKVININLTGAYNCMKEALDRMRPRKCGLIILINSVAGRRAVPLAGVAYNASKFGMAALGISVSEEERENGIRITNIYPGEVNTPILNERIVPPTPEHRASILQPEDVAEVVSTVVFLPARAHIPELVIKPSKQSFI